MKVLHSYCLNYNIGDYALGIGVKNLLRKYLEIDLIAETNIQGQYFTQYYIDEVVNKKYDLLVIGGGGLIDGAHWPNGWFWLIDKELISSIRIPFIVYGVGVNYFEKEQIPEKAISHLRETYERAAFFSVRNDGSYDRIANLVGINPRIVPDPGFHVGLNRDYRRIIRNPYVIIQVANDKTDKRYSNEHSKEEFIISMRRIVSQISTSYHILMAPHVYDDIVLSQEIIRGIPNCSIWNFGNIAFDNIDIAISYYKYASFVLSMRGHGQIIPLSFNVPVIALCNHPKHQSLMINMGLSKYALLIKENGFEKRTLDLIDEICNNYDNLVSYLKRKNEEFSGESKEAFDQIRKALNS